jgi:CubicO group peptidase (beta-lactamase class C family)
MNSAAPRFPVNLQATTFWLLTTVLLVLLMGLPAHAQDQSLDLSGVMPATLTDEMLADIDAYTADTLARYGIPGATIAIVQNGEIIHLNGFGLREMGSVAPVTPDTLFMIGSVPKSMTATMIGTLVDEGILDWDTPVIDVLPTFRLSDPVSTQTVTFRNLLSMSSGIPAFDTPIFVQPSSPEQVIESLADIPVFAAPGEGYAYTNQGYATAGFAAAVAAGAEYGEDVYDTYAQLMQERIFDPIGMQNITFDFEAGVSSTNVASSHGFDLNTGGYSVVPFELEHGGFSIIPAGGTTWSNAEDLARYLIFQMNNGVTSDGTRVIAEQSLLETRTPHTPQPNGNYFGLGWVVPPAFHGLEQIDYGGGNLGYTSYVNFLPGAEIGVVVLTNRAGGDSFTHAITHYVYETAFGLEHEADAVFAAEEEGLQGMIQDFSSQIEAEVEPEAVAAYLGNYEYATTVRFNDAGNFVLSAEFGDFQLYAVPGQQGTFALGRALGLFVQIDENGQSFTIRAGEDQPPLTAARID